MKPTLLVLAAGMGSRYGGLKQMDGLGPNGETIIDYSIYDAMKAEGAKSWSLDDIEFTIKKASERVTVDTKKLKEEFSLAYEECKKVTQVKESLTYKVL